MKKTRKKTRILTFISLMAVVCLWLVSCNIRQSPPVTLKISVANVFREFMEEVSKVYKEQKPNLLLDYDLGGGITLQKQIEQGKKVDIFIPASSKPMDALQTQGLLIPETRKDFVENELVLIVPKGSTTISDFKDLTNERIKTVSIGSESLDAGVYTKAMLKNLNIFDQVKRKALFADEQLRLILTNVATKKVDAGITFASEAKQSNLVKIVAYSPPNSHGAIKSSVAVIKGSKNISESQEFIRFLFSNKVAPLIQKYGLSIN
jgi:molybdate transport system substrate-binding protein